jgi:predicted RNA binding protein YcfA (HicA-like mRNA interferase family)
MNLKLPVISGREAVKVLQKIGYEIVRQRGSHLRLRDKNDPLHKPLSVSDHKELKPGLLRKLIKDANLTVEQFTELWRK